MSRAGWLGTELQKGIETMGLNHGCRCASFTLSHFSPTYHQVVLSSVDDFGRGASLGVTALAMGVGATAGGRVGTSSSGSPAAAETEATRGTSSSSSVLTRKVGAGELLGEAAFFTEVNVPWAIGTSRQG